MAVANVDIQIDAKSALQQLKAVNQQSQQLESSANGATSAITRQGRELQTASNGMRYFVDSTGRARAENGRFLSTAERAAAGLRNQGQAAQGAASNLRQLDTASRATAVGVNSLKTVLGPLLSAFAAIEAARFVFAKTAEIETQTRSIQVLTGSAEQTKKIIQELQQLGAVTPFTSTELIDSAKRLQAFGVEAKEVVDTTRKLADVAGATGAELDGLVTAYGQVQAKGRLQGEELLQFQERGVALQEELRKAYGLSGEEFQKALSKGQISAEAVEFAITRLTEKGGKYANGAIAQSTTLAGKFSTLTDGIEQVARTVGTALTPALKGALDVAIDLVARMNQAFAAASITNEEKQAAKARVEATVMKYYGPLPGGPFGMGQIELVYGGKTYKGQPASVIAQITNAMINKEVERRASANMPPATQGRQTQRSTAPPPLLSGTRPGAGTSADDRQSLDQFIGGQIRSELELQQAKAATLKQQMLNMVAMQDNAKQASRMVEFASQYRNIQLEIGALEETLAKRTQYRAQILKGADQSAIVDFDQQSADIQNQIIIKKEKINQITAEQIGLIGQQIVEDAKLNQNSLTALQDEQALLQARLGGYEAEYILQKQIRDLKAQYPGLDEQQAAGLIRNIELLKQQLTEAEKLKQVYDGVLGTVGQGFASAFELLTKGAEDWGASLKQIASGVLIDIANQLIRIYVIEQAINAIKTLLPSPGGGGGGGADAIASVITGAAGAAGDAGGAGSLPARATGGSVTAGQPYLVGERGPELFMPGKSGGIAPAGSFGGIGNIVVNVDASGSSVQGDTAQGNRLGQVIGAAVRQELINQKRPGGLLA